jgi:hypothetical protein
MVTPRTLMTLLARASLGLTAIASASAFMATSSSAAVALHCSANTTKTDHTGYSTETLHIQTSPRARIVGTAHYQGITRTETATASSAGAALMTFRNPSTHSRFRVVVNLTVTLGTARNTCATFFTLG